MLKLKSLLFIASISVIILSLSGCGVSSKYGLPSKATESKIINSEKLAYVIFGAEEIGATRTNPIFEYFPESETFKFVTILTSNQKYIYPITPGTHYFYSIGGATYDFLKVEAIEGYKYFTNLDVIFWTWRLTTPIVFEPTKDIELIKVINSRILIENKPLSKKWFDIRKNNLDFKAKVKDRFEDWKEDDMKDKTLYIEDGFPIK
ncbi:hypothetical protein OAR97_00435 [Arcobacteraceae bacterium]|nr:hypothetical protein [Arcobacteraceae bacterium]